LLVLLPAGNRWRFQAFGVGLKSAIRLLFRPLVGELLLHTLAISIATALCCAVIGTAAAWFCGAHRSSRPPSLERAGGGAARDSRLRLQLCLVSLSPALCRISGARFWFVTSAYFFRWLYLPVAAALRGMDPSLEEKQRARLVADPGSDSIAWCCPSFARLSWAACCWSPSTCWPSSAAFGLLRYRTFTTEILFAEYRVSFNGPGASLLAGVLILLCLVCLCRRDEGEGCSPNWPHRTRHAAPAPRVMNCAKRSRPSWRDFAILAATTIGVPLATIAYWLTQEGRPAITPAPGLTRLADIGDGRLAGLWDSPGPSSRRCWRCRWVSLPPTTSGPLVTFAGTRSAYLGPGVPGIVIALAIVALAVHTLNPLYQTAALLVIAYAILFLPLAFGQRAGRLRAGAAEAGRKARVRLASAGWKQPGGSCCRWRHRALAPAAAMVFISVVTELTTTLLLAPIGTKTLATQIWVDTSSVAFAAAAPYAALLVNHLAWPPPGCWLHCSAAPTFWPRHDRTSLSSD